jgi:hypothetical protein
MSLGYPSFLWALLVLAIPIIIHLFNFRKTTRVYFSNTRFLKHVKEETIKKRKLKQYLVLVSRLLFLFFLVIAFCQPFLPAKEQMNDQQNIVIYLDNSLSMSSPAGEKKRALDDAIQMAQNILDLFPANTRYRLITNDFAPFSNSYKTKAEAADLLSQIKLSAISRTASDITRRINDKNVTLFWLSDFQKSTFGSPVNVDTTWQVRLVSTELENNPNVFIDSVYLENPFAITGERNTIKVRLRNVGHKKIEGLITKLTINQVQAVATSVNIEPNSFTEIPFDLASGLKASNTGVISFSDFPVSFDNEFFVALNFTSRLSILEIKPTATSTFVEKVFGNKELFAFKSFTTSNLNYSLLASADLVVLNGIDKIESPLAEAINSYKTNFGALMLVPGAKPDIGSYQQILTVPLTKTAPTEQTELDKPDFQNPIFYHVFEEKTTSIAMPHASPVMEWGVDRSAIFKFKNNKPFLSQFGKTFLLASPLEKNFTDFYNHALFVPVMYRIAAQGKKSEQPLYYSLTTITLSIPSDSLTGEDPLRLIGAQEIVPSQRKNNGAVLMELPKDEVSAGFYRITNKKDTVGLLAFDLDKNESLLLQLTPEEAKANLGGKNNISIFKASSSDTFSTEIKERYLGTPLWKYAILLSLLFLLAEILLIRFLK